MFNLLRQLERWLHQHIFKVGWLLTKNFQTTTILYYTFFLPGVFLHELVYWLSAGALDVRADRSIAWPEKQEIGELRLNFVKLSSKASSVKVAVISIAPLLAGLVFISFVANNIYGMHSALAVMHDGSLPSISTGIRQIMSAPDFWLWAYVLFTVNNTMMPDPTALRGWRWVVVGAAAITAPLFIIGVGDEVVGSAVTGPIADVLNVLSSIFVVVIVSDLIAVAILGSLEAVIERITGDSATFQNGKMVVMRREELIAQRKQEREKQRTSRKPRREVAPAQGPPSVYRLVLPIPGPPGKEPVTRKPAEIVASSDSPALAGNAEVRPRRIEPNVVDGTTTGREIRFGPADGDEKEAISESLDRAAPPALRSPTAGTRISDRGHQRKEMEAARFHEADTDADSEPVRSVSETTSRSEPTPNSAGDGESQDGGEVVSAIPASFGQRPQRSPALFRRPSGSEDKPIDGDNDKEVSAGPARFGQRSERPSSPFRRVSTDKEEPVDGDYDGDVSARPASFEQRSQRPKSPFREAFAERDDADVGGDADELSRQSRSSERGGESPSSLSSETPRDEAELTYEDDDEFP